MAVQAELQYNKNTVFAAFAARKSLEQAVKWMYSVDGDLRKPYDDSIQVLVHESTFVNAVPSNIRHDMQLVIKVGNSGVHDTLAVEKKYVLLSLKALFNFLNWLDYTYGSDYQQRKFSEDDIPKGQVVKIPKKVSEDELKKYKDELESKDNTIEELKKQLAEALSSIKDNKGNTVY